VLLPSLNDNERDIEIHFHARLRRLGALPAQHDSLVTALLRKSEGSFLWASFQEKALRTLAKAGPLTVDGVARLPSGMLDTYLESFLRLRERFVKQAGESAGGDTYARVLGLVLAAREPLPLALLRRAAGYGGEPAGKLGEEEEETVEEKEARESSRRKCWNLRRTSCCWTTTRARRRRRTSRCKTGLRGMPRAHLRGVRVTRSW